MRISTGNLIKESNYKFHNTKWKAQNFKTHKSWIDEHKIVPSGWVNIYKKCYFVFLKVTKWADLQKVDISRHVTVCYKSA